MALAASSVFRVDKQRTEAIVTLTNGASVAGHFFTAPGTAAHTGPERVADLLNSEPGLFPFEIADATGPQTVLYNRSHVVAVAIGGDEARRDPGYEFATARHVAVRLSNGERIVGSVRVYRPEDHSRLSDWARHGERFRYIETPDVTYIVNLEHILEAREVVDR
jgi:hypothetical protein